MEQVGVSPSASGRTRTSSSSKVSVIVVSFNTREMTLECLRSVRSQTRIPYELIVVDNASSDGSADAIAAEFPDVTLLQMRENRGFAKANNIASKRATAPLLLLLNPDTIVLDNALDRLVAFAGAHPDGGIWGGRTFFADGRLNPGSCWRDMTLWTLVCQALALNRIFQSSPIFNAEAYGGWHRDTVRRVDIVTGCFLLISRDLWTELSGFDTSYIMYGEDADLCRRARTIGAKPLVTPHAAIVHYGGASEKVRADKQVRLLRAKSTLIHRHFIGWRKSLAIHLLLFFPMSRYVLNFLLFIVTRRPELRAGARSWREVVARRVEWLEGYPPACLSPAFQKSS